MFKNFAVATLLTTGLLGFGASHNPAQASDCSLDEYDHNGSMMEIQICSPNADVSISYVRPKRSIQGAGVTDGTLLFDGILRANGEYSGTARVFSRVCGEMLYGVSGFKRGNRITLRGLKPVRDRNCNIVEDRNDTLVFTEAFNLQRPQGPQVVTPTCPRGFVFNRGQCVRQGGGFNNQPRPRPIPQGSGPSGGNWLAIAGSFRSRRDADNLGNQLGFDWKTLDSNNCPNLGRNFWITAARSNSRSGAQSFVDAAGYDAYVKQCN